MQLTDPAPLLPSYTKTDVYELAAIGHSTLLTTPLARLRYENIPEDEALEWMRESFASNLKAEFSFPRISQMTATSQLLDTQCGEHVVIRDLDLEPLITYSSTNVQEAVPRDQKILGRIVGHVEFLYHPSYAVRELSNSKADVHSSTTARFPSSGNSALHTHFNSLVDSALATTFAGLPCFSVEDISTLTPSHVRRGIARQLVDWIFPIADREHIPVILAASPLGHPLYAKTGFQDVGGEEGAVRCDMREWGWNGPRQGVEQMQGTEEHMHKHILMVRWPPDLQQLDQRWKQWRRRRELD